MCQNTNICFKEVAKGNIVAEGASGKVFKGVYKGMEVAVKTFNELALSYNETEIRREIGILRFVVFEIVFVKKKHLVFLNIRISSLSLELVLDLQTG